ncbi:MAG: hypothetical protein ACRDWN_10385, partial [Acidimicrobiales bacterium]
MTPPQAGAPAPFTLKLSVTGAPAGTTVTASLYGKLGTRTGLESALRSSPARTDGPQVDRTAPVPLTDLPTGADGRVGLTIAVVPSAAAGPAPAPGTPALDLSCPVTVGGACTGVYPVVVSLASATGTGLATFTTFLTYAQSTSAERLRFAWVVPVAAPTSVRRTAAPAGQAVAPLAPGAASSLEGLVTDLQRAPSVPVTLDPEPATLQALAGTGSAGRAAVHTLAGMSAGQAGDETATGPYVRVDLGALAGAGEGTEIHAQMVEGAAVLAKLRVETGTDSTWVATGPVGASTGSGLSQVGAQRVVVPDNALARATVKSGATWTWPFDLPFGDRGPVLPAAAADGELADQFTAHPGDPALAAAQLLADLAMVHFELPYTATPRGMVAVPPPGWHPTAAFDRQLLAGLAGNPVVVPVTLSTFFATVPAHGARHLEGAGAGPSLPVSAARLLTAARQRVTAFDSAAPGATAVTTQLDQALLSSEAADLKSRTRS